MLIVRGIMWISVLIVMLICMVKTKRNGMKKKIRYEEKDTGIDICRIFVYIICFYAIFNGSSDRESFYHV